MFEPHSNDLFLAKYSDEGDVLWADAAGGSYDDFITSMNVLTDGSVIVSGPHTDSTAFTFGNSSVFFSGQKSAFIVKYNDAGNADWIRGFEGLDFAWSILGTNSVLNVLSTFDGTIDLDGNVITSLGANKDVLLAKLDITTGYVLHDPIPFSVFPNPFNTLLTFATSMHSPVVTISDLFGRFTSAPTGLDLESRSWDGRDMNGNEVPPACT